MLAFNALCSRSKYHPVKLGRNYIDLQVTHNMLTIIRYFKGNLVDKLPGVYVNACIYICIKGMI